MKYVIEVIEARNESNPTIYDAIKDMLNRTQESTTEAMWDRYTPFLAQTMTGGDLIGFTMGWVKRDGTASQYFSGCADKKSVQEYMQIFLYVIANNKTGEEFLKLLSDYCERNDR